MINWKDKYKHQWAEANQREQIVFDYLKKFGYEPIVSGFEAMSTNYNPKNSKEPGKPDLMINVLNKEIYFEVTGTSKNCNSFADIWVRPDKLSYVIKNNINCYLVHILSKINLVRYINLKDIPTNNLITPSFGGSTEIFYSFPASLLKPITKLEQELKANVSIY